MSPPDAPPSVLAARPQRRRLRIRLRTMMALVLTLGGGMGWWVHRVQIQRDAVVLIRRSGGSVVYDWQYGPAGNLIPGRQPSAPRWLVGWLGPDHSGRVVCATFGKIPIRDADLAAIGSLTSLRELNLAATALTDAGLAHLRNLVAIKALDLGDTAISSAGLVHLRGMTNLLVLGLARTKVTDLDPLVGTLDHLISLDLSGTLVTDAGLEPLARSPDLHLLLLPKTAITDASLAHLRQATRISALLVDETAVTDEGIDRLPEFRQLRNLSLTRTKVSLERVARLRRQYPIALINR